MYLPEEKSTQSLPAFKILIFKIAKSEKSISKASLNELLIIIFFTEPLTLMKFTKFPPNSIKLTRKNN